MADFAKLSLDELVSARDEIDTLITQRQKEAKNDLIREFRAKADSLGIDFDELVSGSPKKRSGGKVAPKYRNPEDNTVTWTGRGQQPKWVKAQISQGKTLEDLLIGPIRRPDSGARMPKFSPGEPLSAFFSALPYSGLPRGLQRPGSPLFAPLLFFVLDPSEASSFLPIFGKLQTVLNTVIPNTVILNTILLLFFAPYLLDFKPFF